MSATQPPRGRRAAPSLPRFGSRLATPRFDRAALFAGAGQGVAWLRRRAAGAGAAAAAGWAALDLPGQGRRLALLAGSALRTGQAGGRAAAARAVWLACRCGRALRQAGLAGGRLLWPAETGWRRLASAGLGLALAVALAPQPEAQTTQPEVLGINPQNSLMGSSQAGGIAAAGSSGSAVRTMRGAGAAPQTDPNAPVTFTADEVEYDRESGIVTARGRVEAWQGERVLRADSFTYNRETGEATAQGNVQLLEPDGQVMFADSAELKDKFKDGVLREVRALLAANVRIAANGVRRTGGTINELSRVVYSSCDLCADNPEAPPAWQVRARIATQDKELQRITYRDAVMQVHGVPVFYTPYLSHPDPSAPRQSGFLFPQLGATRYLDAFAMVPYYWVIDNHSDLTLTGLFSTRQYPFLLGDYRNVLNNGMIEGNASLGALGNNNKERRNLAGHIFLNGRFTLDENWRAGFSINRASSDTYLQTIRTWSRPIYASNAYVEGFWGTEQYARIDMRGYQSLALRYDNRLLPYVLPYAQYEYAPKDSIAGGHLTLDSNLLSIFRIAGPHTQRIGTRANWTRQDFDDFGGLWNFRVQGDVNGYWAEGQAQAPINLPGADGLNSNANLRAAVDWRMPFVRSGEWGSQLLEPRVQLVTGPRMGRQTRLPNEDAIDFEFTDANLFSLNRYPGRDRFEGGTRVDAAMRGVWTFPNGAQVDGLVGRSYRLQDDHSTSQLYTMSGLENRASDWVARMRVAPVSWLDAIARVRTDGHDLTQRRLVDGEARVRVAENLTLHAGYLYATAVPYLSPYRSREEVSAGFTARIADNWRINTTAKYDLSAGRFAIIQGAAGYEDECVIIEGRFLKRFAQDVVTSQNIPISTVVLVHVGLKTLGDYYFRAL